MTRDFTLQRPLGIPGTVSHFAALTVNVWRDITARQLWTVGVLLLAYAGILTLGALPTLLERRQWTSVVNAVLSAELSGFAVMFAVLLAERATASRNFRWWPYALAVTGGVGVAAVTLWVLSQQLIGITTSYVDAGTAEPFGNFVLRHWLHASFVCGLGTAVYVARRRALERMADLRALQRLSTDSEKLVLKARLAALQARVEPRFLLDALARIERLYEQDSNAADTLLRHLVRYLRASLPEMRDLESTLGKELKLAEAYIAVGHGAEDFRLRVRLAGMATENTSVPPLVLLPLIDHALADRSHGGLSGRYFEVDTRVEPGLLQIMLRDTEQGFAPKSADSEAIALLRERLRALHGESATLVFRAAPSGSFALLEIRDRTDR